MTAFYRGIQLYLLLLAFTGTLAMVWGTNWLLLDSTTGWPPMLGLSGVLVILGGVVHHRWTPDDGDPTLSPYPWSSNN